MPRQLGLLSVFIAAVAVAAVVVVGRPAGETSAAVTLDAEEQAFVTLINNYRAQNGLGALLIDGNIQAAAEWKSGDMGANNYFAHNDQNGRDPWTRMCDFGYCYNTWKGENIAAGYTTALSVFNAWKASPGHNANMLGANFKVMGIARVYTAGSNYSYYWTNDFGGYIVPGGAPTNTPTAPPTPTLSPTPSPSPSPSRTPSPTPVPTASPSPTPNPSCPGDADCDGSSDVFEIFTGTNRFVRCSATVQINDESPDARPSDMNDDRVVSYFDAYAIAAKFGSTDRRADLSMDGRVNMIDVSVLSRSFGSSC